MNYVLLFVMLHFPPEQIGPFDSVHACELALTQVQTLTRKVNGVCINLKAKPHHWNGKELPK